MAGTNILKSAASFAIASAVLASRNQHSREFKGITRSREYITTLISFRFGVEVAAWSDRVNFERRLGFWRWTWQPRVSMVRSHRCMVLISERSWMRMMLFVRMRVSEFNFNTIV
ncbi:hypothetical protein KC19_3G095900 [Ceratodon purpureus]|uniref:Uncharacterized protein n=1 Tax=Ceratodon purpureus TaxID=3225 RepID=A0A8T0IKG8_CERPU|nr:hypothetical protein KC19_3G095900 [Ceratodon purpureus]